MKHIFLNNSALSSLHSCLRQYQITCLWGYGGSGNTYTDFGSAVHDFAAKKALGILPTGLELVKWFADNNIKDSKLIGTCLFYDNTNPLAEAEIVRDVTGTPVIERWFDAEYQKDSNYTFTVCGTIDRLDRVDGELRVVDHKTAWDVKKDKVLSKYEAHLQLPFYLLALRDILSKSLTPADQSLIADGKFYGKYHGIFVSIQSCQLSGRIVLTNDMANWIYQILDLSIQLIKSVDSLGDNLAPPTGMCSDACVNCWLKDYCINRSDQSVKDLLSLQTPKPYDPRKWR